MSISVREMSAKRDHHDHNHNDNCEAEDLSMPLRKKLKGIPPLQFKHGLKQDEEKRDLFKYTKQKFGKMQSLTVEMDLEEPMTTLRALVEEKVGMDLSSSIICLQDKIEMDPDSSLGDQCVTSNVRAEIKIEVKMVDGDTRVNIVDVLKLKQDSEDGDADEYEENSSVEDLSIKTNSNNCNDGQLDDRSDSSSISDTSSTRTPYPWSILRDVTSLFPIPIPSDPLEWTDEHTHHWLKWALKEFNIKFVDDSMWTLSGNEFSRMTEEEFHQKVPLDPKKLFWTHTELLRKCRIFAVPDKTGQRSQVSLTGAKVPKKTTKKPRSPSASTTPGNGQIRRAAMTGHNGQIQLWQFLLELLGDKNSKNVIQWVGRDGEFKLNDPELVAQMWGQRKNKPKMNYEKLSRALRYYYSEAMIAKVHGRRFVYKFVCNLKELIGYSTEELINLVEDEPVVFDTLV